MLKEIGEYKDRLSSIFVTSDKICTLLLGEDYENKIDDLDNELGKYIIPHLYVPETVTEQHSYIMFETYVPNLSSTIKTMKIVIEAICHKGVTKYKEKPKGYYGPRYDVLAQYIEELLCPNDEITKKNIIKKFGIGGLEMKPDNIFLTNDFIGRTLTFMVPDFR